MNLMRMWWLWPFRQLRLLRRLLMLAAPLLLITTAMARAPTRLTAPPPEAQAYSFSVARNSPAAALGFHPADILGAAGFVLIPCENLGLVCTGGDGVQDDITAMSYKQDFGEPGLPPVQFSVAAGTAGVAGSAVAAEAGCTPAQAHSDVFQTDLKGSNAQDLDGDGLACAGNAGLPLDMVENPVPSEVDALDGDPCASVDLDCNGTPDEGILLALAVNSPTLASIGASTGDILRSAGVDLPDIWATRAQLGLKVGDAIDGLCVRENGDGVYGEGDLILLSLAPGSASLGTLKPGDLLRPAPLRLAYAASKAGLSEADNLDAMVCNSDAAFIDVYMPLIDR